MVMSARSWLLIALGAFGGGAGMVILGQLSELAGGSCAILCKPPVAGLYGAVLGLLLS